MRSRGQQVTTQQSANAPWSVQQPYLESGFGEAGRLFGIPREQFPGPLSVPISPLQATARQAGVQAALAPQPLLSEAQRQYGSTIGGEFLDQGNPAFARMAERAIQPLRQEFTDVINPSIEGQFSARGRGSSNLQKEFVKDRAQQNFARAVGDIGANLAYPSYEAERARQYGALPIAAQMQGLDYYAPGQLEQFGALERMEDARRLGDFQSRFDYPQEEPYTRLASFMGNIAGPFGSETTQTTTGPETFTNPPLALAGGVGAGATIGSMFGSEENPYGYPGWGATAGGLLAALGLV